MPGKGEEMVAAPARPGVLRGRRAGERSTASRTVRRVASRERVRDAVIAHATTAEGPVRLSDGVQRQAPD
jgi:hypothetical protein